MQMYIIRIYRPVGEPLVCRSPFVACIYREAVMTNSTKAAAKTTAEAQENGQIVETVEVILPLKLRISDSRISGIEITSDGAASVTASVMTDVTAKIPYIDRDYSGRKGYQDNFLGIRVPLPSLEKNDVVAKMDDGNHVIPYEHFSIVMHAKRRLALFSASNIDGTPKKRKPEPGNYNRHELGQTYGQSETWILDDRISFNEQLSDGFFNRDRKSFDKGHLVRREDVCWGNSYEQVRKANGDTFHITNCTPQVSDFNQANHEGIWGLLEDVILDQAKLDESKYTIFAGPVLNRRDDYFEGWSPQGPIKVQIPREYWKIVVFKSEGSLQAYAFLLEQTLKHVRWEATARFEVSADWEPYLISIKDLQKKLSLITFHDVLVAADGYNSSLATVLLSKTVLRRFA